MGWKNLGMALNDADEARYVCQLGWEDLGHILGAGKENEARQLGASIR